MDQLQAFILQRRNEGVSDKDIAVELLYDGWNEDQIREGMHSIDGDKPTVFGSIMDPNQPPAYHPVSILEAPSLPSTPQTTYSSYSTSTTLGPQLSKAVLVLPVLLIATGLVVAIYAAVS